WRKPKPIISIASIIIGLVGGIMTYFLVESDISDFYGNLASLILPFIVVIVGSIFTKDEFNFESLKNEREEWMITIMQLDISENKHIISFKKRRIRHDKL